ncbi:MAG: hypothetical protein WD075_10315 [Rhodospirillales bacterium]
MSDAKGPPDSDRSPPQERRGTGERRRENLTAADVLGWDGTDRRQQDRRSQQERRQAERIEQDRVWEKDTLEGFWPMDAAAQTAHDKRQSERRDRERRMAQASPEDVANWNGKERRDLERRELERRIRAAQIADKGENPGV